MLYYKIASPIGKVLIKSACKGKKLNGFGGCSCYKKYEHFKCLSMTQLTQYQQCKYNVKVQKTNS